MIHIAGLRRMVELRGGLDQLQQNPPLLMKICKMDLVYALPYGGQTAFSRDNLAEVRQTLRSQGCVMDDFGVATLSDVSHGSVLDCDLVTQRLKDTLARTIHDEACESRFWLMMMGAIWTWRDDQVAAWLRPVLS
ncbi:uncharacterized protein J7T54_000253 [Emericellopsis cladophorae]|uniref:Uncharacterized protein n=1 Tax=Emericellopsis cladophorae TaxID=2686198 RepID=A0A9P9XY07_9HYPO|nr:uncharacterized protein J7T54_000253 [Emericellopsis cladophorae]KAI6779953.1 hypothetical protein J7T54_000253 [Emericellopsis cladophorae]